MEFLNGKDSFAFFAILICKYSLKGCMGRLVSMVKQKGWGHVIRMVWTNYGVVCYWKELGAICPSEKLVNFCPTKNDNIFEPAPLSVISHEISFTSALSFKQSAMCGALSEQNSKKEQDNLNSQWGNALLIKLQPGNPCGWCEACVVLKSRPASQPHCCLWILLC